MAKSPLPRLAILGAGPVGLEAALYASALGYPFALYERGQPSENLRAWGHVKLFTPFGMNVSPLGRATLKADIIEQADENRAKRIASLRRDRLLCQRHDCDRKKRADEGDPWNRGGDHRFVGIEFVNVGK